MLRNSFFLLLFFIFVLPVLPCKQKTSYKKSHNLFSFLVTSQPKRKTKNGMKSSFVWCVEFQLKSHTKTCKFMDPIWGQRSYSAKNVKNIIDVVFQKCFRPFFCKKRLTFHFCSQILFLNLICWNKLNKVKFSYGIHTQTQLFIRADNCCINSFHLPT